jgi:hypothetical protein
LLTTVTNLTGNTVFFDPTEDPAVTRFYKAEPLDPPSHP